MEKISLSEQKNVEFNILKYIDSICKENNIEYSLCGGTLLGAIRHKGFIPWDDDVDVFLIRPEYERLLNIIKLDDQYSLIPSNSIEHSHVFSKVIDKRTVMIMNNPHEPIIPNLGVHIDLFPIDGAPSDPNEQEKFTKSLRKIMFNMRMAMPNSYYNSEFWWKRLIKRVVYFPRHLLMKYIASPEEWKLILLKSMQNYEFTESSHAGFVLSAYGIKEILPKECFEGKLELEFEGDKFYAFPKFEHYLKAIYGNYIELPPVEKQVSHHNYTPYWKD